MILEKSECFDILNKHLKADGNTFWTKALETTELCRFTTNFQFQSFEDKLRQYYFTHNTICFGNALEEIVHVFLEKNGAIFLNRKLINGYDCDQLFTYGDKVVLIEQKIRDDHDSTKKKGQLNNFLAKKTGLKEKYKNVFCSSWFIDDSLSKNKKFYLNTLTDNYELTYGDEIEKFLQIIFEDNRADNFVSTLSDYLCEYRQTFDTRNIFTGVNINYEALSPAKLYALFVDKQYRNKIAQYFFNGHIPYENILNFYKKKSKIGYVPKVITMLESEING